MEAHQGGFPPPDSSPQRGGADLSWHLLWVGALGLAAMTRWPSPFWLLLPGGAVLAWSLLDRKRPWPAGASALVLIVGVLVGFGTLPRGPTRGSMELLGPLSEEEVGFALSRRFNQVLEAGDQALEQVGVLMASPQPADLQSELSRIRRTKGLTALAIYEADGRLRAWVGVHRGQVPQPIRRGDRRYAFGGGPLFRYLYFTARDSLGGGTAVAAVLLHADLPGGFEGRGFSYRFRRETGVPIQILPPYRAVNSAIWDLNWEGEPMLSVALATPDSSGLPSEGGSSGVGLLAVLAFLAWAFLAGGGRGLAGHRTGAAATLLMGIVLVPARGLLPGAILSSPAHFLLPGPLGGTLGKVLLLLGGFVLLAGLFAPLRWGREGSAGDAAAAAPEPSPGRWVLLAGGLVAVGAPILALGFALAPSSDLFRSGAGGWVLYQVALALLLSVVTGFGLALARAGPGRPGPLRTLGAGLGLAPLLALLGAVLARGGPGLQPAFLSLWGIPALLAAWGLRGRQRGGVALTWVTAALLGSTAALPYAWANQIQARLALAEGRLGDLGAEPEPFLEFRLARMAEVADSLDGVISAPVELLYETWSQTGPKDDPLPMWLTLWSPGDLPGEDLAMGVQASRPAVADDFLDVAREEGRPLIRYLGMADARYVLVVPLLGRRVLSAVVPSRGSLSLATPLGPIFAAWGREQVDKPRLVPASPDDPVRPTDEVLWEQTREGWRGRRVVSFGAEGIYYASLDVALPGNLHMVARGTLTLLLDILLGLGLWGLGQAVGRGRETRVRETWRILGTFRARVTLALFGFFLLSVAIFGTLAFQTLSGAAQRTASALAERIVEDGASFYLEVQGSMQLLAQEVGAELLEYRNGELVGGSSHELVQLGLYEGWIPESVYRPMEGRQGVSGTQRSALGRWDYVMAYRRLPDGDILASPVPVEAGATALRRQEVADILGFAIVLGAALSLALALLVGRTLTRPIETLQVASERVGSGNLRVRLPESRDDEFGAVFEAFNRMVLGIRRARRALIRTTRRTQVIVEEAATGVVALDAAGRVTLANPRAEALVGEHILSGERLPGREGAAAELVRWVDLYFRDGLLEGNTEFQLGDRRIRIRARRISGEEPLGGAVLSLEDVTDELRTERVLAWGEMARQVAHEVKNPLTPIKLSVQHLQRAWEDRRPEFGEILERNVEVILREIEHLAAIARSFSRFAAPHASGEFPLEPVSIHGVAEEVMNLYRGGKGALSFRCTVSPDLPPVRSREAELREVLINLLENSRVAIPEEGEVVIQAQEGERLVELQVRDNGTGIPPELLSRIFEPHFSTRSTGTGLGLAIVRRLVESWGGVVTAESRMGEGTVIRMSIPRWDVPEEVGEELEHEGE